MPNIFIDPYVFACPQPEEGLEQFRNYIESIVSWREFREAGWASVYISVQTPEVLAQTNSYPPWNNLIRAIKMLQIEDVQAKDVVDIITSLLTKLPTIEDTFLIHDVLIEQVTYSPSYHVDKRLPLFRDHYERMAIFLCMIIHLTNENVNNLFLVTRHLNDNRYYSEAKGRVIDCEYSGNLKLPICPFDIDGHFWLCNTPQGLYLTVDSFSIWAKAKDLNDYHAAIRIYVYQMSQEAESPVILDELSWSFNSRFLITARTLGFLHEEKKVKNLFRACAETILAYNMKATHALREGTGAEEAQRTRGKDKAWRRDIDYEYHLHYWETQNGPEFAAIVIHNDMSIPK